MTAICYQGPFFSFGHLTNASYMKQVWRTWLPLLLQQPVKIKSCVVHHARCRTHLAEVAWDQSYIGINYEFELGGYQANTAYNPMLFCRAFLNGNSFSAYENLLEEYQGINRSVDFQHIPELDMIAWCFPADPALIQLPLLLDANRVLNYLPCSQHQANYANGISGVSVKLIRYRPEQRCIIRYEFRYVGSSKMSVVYAKTYDTNKSERVFLRMQQCHEALIAIGYRTAKPLHYSPQITTIWLEELTGVALTGLVP